MNSRMSIIQAEAEGVKFGLKYAYDAGLRLIEVETDSMTLAAMLQARRKENSTTQVIVHDILSLAKSFATCIFNHARRSCNVVAHSMAKNSLLYEEVLVFMEDCPSNILPLVLADKANIEYMSHIFPSKK